MQGLPCSDCRRHMVGHSESKGPVSVSIYARDLLFLYQHCRDGPKKFHTSKRVRFGTVAGCLFFYFFETSNSQGRLNWPRFSNDNLDMDSVRRQKKVSFIFQEAFALWLNLRKKSCSHQVTRLPSVLTVHYKSRKILVRPLGKPYLKTLFAFLRDQCSPQISQECATGTNVENGSCAKCNIIIQTIKFDIANYFLL